MSEILLEIVINIMTKFTSSSHSVQKGYSHAPSERDEREERSEIENYYKIFKPTDDGHTPGLHNVTKPKFMFIN